jgi:hypothetical protein
MKTLGACPVSGTATKERYRGLGCQRVFKSFCGLKPALLPLHAELFSVVELLCLETGTVRGGLHEHVMLQTQHDA